MSFCCRDAISWTAEPGVAAHHLARSDFTVNLDDLRVLSQAEDAPIADPRRARSHHARTAVKRVLNVGINAVAIGAWSTAVETAMRPEGWLSRNRDGKVSIGQPCGDIWKPQDDYTAVKHRSQSTRARIIGTRRYEHIKSYRLARIPSTPAD